MSAVKIFIHKALLCLFSICVITAAVQAQYAGAVEDGVTVKFKDSDPKPPERYKLDNTSDGQENVRVIELLKKYAKEYTPVPVPDEAINVIDFTIGPKSWHFGYGRNYFISGYETAVSLYMNQASNTLNDYQLAIQSTDGLTPTSRVYDDLNYTLTSLGISGSLYYLNFNNRRLSLGVEVALLAISSLSITSKKADKSYSSNGLTLLGYPVWRHTHLIPFKIRYQPLKNFAIQFAVHYVYYGVWQETTRAQRENSNTAGEWFQGCDSELCSESKVFPAIGVQVIF